MHESILKLISLGTIIIFAIWIVFLMLELFKTKNPLKSFFKKNQMIMLLIVSVGATFGSLLLSFYFKLAPCDLCWYQRIFLFPIPFITAIGLISKDMYSRVYVRTLAVIGLLIASYHSVLQMQVFKKDTIFCNPTSLVDCATPDFIYYGFVTVPVISFVVFLTLILLSYSYETKN